MGITCSSRILALVPALIETVKQAGLVLVSDNTVGPDEGTLGGGLTAEQEKQRTREGWGVMQEGVSGVMKLNGVLRFNESIDM
jgi:CDK inhibitor PHO81